MIKRLLLAVVLSPAFLLVSAQQIDKIINATEAERIEKTLSADDMQGRKTFTAGIEKAADFIEAEFKKSGLQYFYGLNSYRQPFSMIKAKFISASGMLDNNTIVSNNIIAVTTAPELMVDEQSGYTKIMIDSSANLMKEASYLLNENKKYLVLVSSAQAKKFFGLKRFKKESFETKQPIIFVLSDINPVTYHFEIKHQLTNSSLANVVGMLPGNSKKDELVIFSAHYDHLGISKANAAGDSIYNGANDDAAGTTAIIMLADYFSKIKNNERTLLFVAFTAEEIGGFGSQYFSRQIDAAKIMAMFNIEMIGTESKWGTNSAYITGYEKSDMGKILQQNLTGTSFHFVPDPYPTQNLFYRSDNATLAALGVPAHTISTSKMDSEKNYHTQADEITTLDMNNMAEIIKAIALSSHTIVKGTDTPTRVEKLEK